MELTTPLLADACLRLGIPLRLAPPGLQALLPGTAVVGRVLPAYRYGSVDAFLGLAGIVVWGCEELWSVVRSIQAAERRQAQAILQGRKLRDQFRFDEYPARRAADPAHDFRRHLRELGAAIEE